MISQRKWQAVLRRAVFLLLLVAGPARPAEPVNGVLTNAADVLALSAKEALSGVPVCVTGIVTTAETDWNGQFFIQDATAGIFVVNYDSQLQPRPGEVVEVTGVSHRGGYAPTIVRPQLRKLGTAPLPKARPPKTFPMSEH